MMLQSESHTHYGQDREAMTRIYALEARVEALERWKRECDAAMQEVFGPTPAPAKEKCPACGK